METRAVVLGVVHSVEVLLGSEAFVELLLLLFESRKDALGGNSESLGRLGFPLGSASFAGVCCANIEDVIQGLAKREHPALASDDGGGGGILLSLPEKPNSPSFLGLSLSSSHKSAECTSASTASSRLLKHSSDPRHSADGGTSLRRLVLLRFPLAKMHQALSLSCSSLSTRGRERALRKIWHKTKTDSSQRRKPLDFGRRLSRLQRRRWTH